MAEELIRTREDFLALLKRRGLQESDGLCHAREELRGAIRQWSTVGMGAIQTLVVLGVLSEADVVAFAEVIQRVLVEKLAAQVRN